ncbi:F-box/RNI-like/FBD-like domains-containing protein [Rhynchospora pubera]|uniref:F-box/RNI-like/FBD-like domains-containing protein n=1 Tax=Rhynchospora pubera TaxID=906938 RepID=A0AAV8CEN8_9POAL|nr:F-box/RNI-like/FBD-like domains-containing protein [Rhynchospora pubera]
MVYSKEIRVLVFIDFVSTMLLLREASDLNKIHLTGYVASPFRIMRSWILYALKHNLQVLNVDCIPECTLPLGVFTCASLADALVGSYISLHNLDVINLPCFKQLSLKDIDINQDFVDKLLCGCPVLEFLNLEGRSRDFSTINSHSLKYLKIQTWCFSKEAEKKMEFIDTPNLLSFSDSICPYLNGQKVPLKMPSLTSASIHLDVCDSNKFLPETNKLLVN